MTTLWRTIEPTTFIGNVSLTHEGWVPVEETSIHESPSGRGDTETTSKDGGQSQKRN